MILNITHNNYSNGIIICSNTRNNIGRGEETEVFSGARYFVVL